MTLSKILMCQICMVASCIVVCSEPYSISRVSKENIKKNMLAFQKEFSLNQKLRKFTSVGLTVGGSAAAAGLVYLMFFAKTDQITGHIDFQKPNLETLEDVKAAVIEQGSALNTLAKMFSKVKSLRVGSLGWAKSWAWYIAGSSFVVGTLIDKAFYYGSSLLNKVFYNRSLSWFLASRTHIGSLVLKKIDERDQYEMSWADVVKELEQSATKLQSASVDDAQYHKQRIATNLNVVIADIEYIIAFIQQWLSTIKCLQSLKRDMCDRLHHIKVISNKVAENLENVLNAPSGGPDTPKYLSSIKCYCVELEQELIGLIRGEQELLRQVSPA